MTVLIHTTATPEWSNLALSGLYIQVLKRLSDMAEGIAITENVKQQNIIQPIMVLDGFGDRKTPDASVESIDLSDLENFNISHTHPPGVYGYPGYSMAVNMGDYIDAVERVNGLPLGVKQLTYKKDQNFQFMPWLLLLAALLFLIDWIAMIIMSGRSISLGFGRSGKTATTSLFIIGLLIGLSSSNAHALTIEEEIKYASEMHMAYIKSANAELNNTTERGLEQLARILTTRTSVEPQGVVGLNIENDALSLFPFIYWPVHSSKSTLTETEARKVQQYLDNGGLILFDTRDQPDQTSGQFGFGISENTKILRSLLSTLNIPELSPINEGHVLSKSFYLLKSFPGKYEGGTLWVELASTDPEKRTGLDGVSGVIIGSNDWASAWAASIRSGQSIFNLSGGSRQQEMAFRFGINLMMYALTGNYKADQVHVPFILDRLGQ